MNLNPTPLAGALRKAAVRLLPFLLLLYVLAFLDRVNVAYAKPSMLRDNGWSEAVYAFGSGIFFAGYALFEVPSTLLMHRVGARAWICRIMVSWGLISAAMMYAHTSTTFYTLRFLLGVAEAGFFPGIIIYLASWFPDEGRGRMLGLFYFGAPLAQILGGPISGLLLELNGVAGLKGWQWLFLAEGLLAIGAGVVAATYLTNHPREAKWLSEAERTALQRALAVPAPHGGEPRAHRAVAALRQPRVLYFGLVYGLIQMSVYGLTFYLPATVARLLSRQIGFQVGLVSAVPWLCALAAAYAAPRWVKRPSQRGAIAGWCLLGSALGLAAASASNPALAMTALCCAAAGFIGAQPIFWTFPTAELTGVRAAGGIALINSMGAVGGFLAPNVKALAEQVTGAPAAGFLTLAATTLFGAVLIARLAPARTCA